jgi:S-methylmethionine-dependent homocysteine/selenocysteine methylase
MYINCFSLKKTHKILKEQHGLKKIKSYPSSGKKQKNKTFKVLA